MKNHPSELEQINRSTFRALGASASDTERILHGGAFTPTQATTFAVHLKALKGVANRGAFVKVAAQKSTTEADALFCVYTAALMNQIHQKTPIARIVMRSRLSDLRRQRRNNNRRVTVGLRCLDVGCSQFHR